MRKTNIYRYFRALYLSFYAPALYVDVVKRWQGFGIGYLLMVIAIGSIPLSSRIIIDFDQYFEEKILLPLQVLPALNIKKGHVLFEKPMPYLIKNKIGHVISIIDTSGAVTQINNTYPQLSVLVTKNELLFQPPSFKQFLGLTTSSTGNKIYSRTFSKESSGIFDAKHWMTSSGILKLNTLIKTFIFPLITLFYFAIAITLMFIVSTLGQLCCDVFFGFKLKFKASCRLLAVSSTPFLALFFLVRTQNFMFRGLGFIYFILLVSYFFYAAFSVKHEQALKSASKI
jgi:hypothetical protein